MCHLHDKARANPTVQCADSSWRCLFWALPVFGYCEKYAEVRAALCPLSCGGCATDPADNGGDDQDMLNIDSFHMPLGR